MTILPVLLFSGLGAVSGAIHFLAISKEADNLVRSGSAGLAIGLKLGRMALTIAVLMLAARQGWAALLAATTGLMIARTIVIRRMGPTP